MEEASQVRRAARAAVEDTYPERLTARIRRTIDTGSMAPGVVVLLSARLGKGHERLDDPAVGTDGDEPAVGEALSSRAAGVQLIYEGLRLTRSLASGEPWEDPDSDADRTDADIAILAADVLVARGFHVLARTEVADRAVETVQHFGRDQTAGRDSNSSVTVVDPTLETDAIDLAIRCGLSAAGQPVPPTLAEAPLDLTDVLLADRTDEDEQPGFRGLEDDFSAIAEALSALPDDRPTGVSEGVPPTTDG